MIAGHFFLAFTLAALFMHLKGFQADKCLKLGLAAGCFALLPDLDIIYAWKEIFTLFSLGFYGFTESFWTASETLHRGLTHSLFLLIPFTLALTAYHRTREKYLATSIILFTSLTGLVVNGILSAAIMLLFSVLGVLITDFLRSYSYRQFLVAGFSGLVIHPFGDLFTGSPPEIFFPLSIRLFPERIVFFPDAAVNFIVIFLIEVSFIWTALLAYSRIKDQSIPEAITPLSLLSVSYILVSTFIRRPTLGTSYQFVFSAVGLAATVAALIKLREGESRYSVYAVNFVFVLTCCAFVYLGFYLF